MVGSRWRRTLHFLEQAGTVACPGERPGRAAYHDYRALIIVSEPIDGTARPEIPERSAFEVTPDLRLRIQLLDES